MKRPLVTALVVAFAVILIVVGLISGNNFAGMDETVNQIANEYAREVGAGERAPFINTDQGDLLLFLFGLSGAVVGFYLGYQWRNLFGQRKEGEDGPRFQ